MRAILKLNCQVTYPLPSNLSTHNISCCNAMKGVFQIFVASKWFTNKAHKANEMEYIYLKLLLKLNCQVTYPLPSNLSTRNISCCNAMKGVFQIFVASKWFTNKAHKANEMEYIYLKLLPKVSSSKKLSHKLPKICSHG
jgi:hypothetical protein